MKKLLIVDVPDEAPRTVIIKDAGVYVYGTTSFEIITPPTDEEIEKKARKQLLYDDESYMAGVFWTLKRLGL